MAFHRCAISAEDGRVVAQDVDVAVEETKAQWYGTVTATPQTELVAGKRYRLVMDDGRSGEFEVRRNTSTSGPNRAVAIRGIGSLK